MRVLEMVGVSLAFGYLLIKALLGLDQAARRRELEKRIDAECNRCHAKPTYCRDCIHNHSGGRRR